MKYYVYHGSYLAIFFCVSFLVAYSYAIFYHPKTHFVLLTRTFTNSAFFIMINKAVSWPTLLHVAEDRGKIVGYVLAKLDEESPKVAKGHITSLSVLRTHRKLGIAAKLMIAANDALMTTYKTESCSLHVRVSNKAALHLYVDTLGYENTGTEKAYYADGEDAHNMRLSFKYGLKEQGLNDEELKVLERLGLLDVK
jgi:ribosomal protein S18 acetylase RimI-like enzyme